jgi:hypothetical protein
MSKITDTNEPFDQIIKSLQPRKPLFGTIEPDGTKQTRRGILANTTGQLYLVQVTGVGNEAQKNFESVQRYTDELLMDCIQEFIKPIKEFTHTVPNIVSWLPSGWQGTAGNIISSVESAAEKVSEEILDITERMRELTDISNRFNNVRVDNGGKSELRIDIEFVGLVPGEELVMDIENVIQDIISATHVLGWPGEIIRKIGIIPAHDLIDNLLRSSFIIDPSINDGTDIYDHLLTDIKSPIIATLTSTQGQIDYEADTHGTVGPPPDSNHHSTSNFQISNHLAIKNHSPRTTAIYAFSGGRLNYLPSATLPPGIHYI